PAPPRAWSRAVSRQPVPPPSASPSGTLSLRGRRLLARDGTPRPLARARVGVRPLAADGQVPPVAEPAVAAEIDQAFDARRDVAAEVALDLVAGVDRASKTRRLLVGQVVALAPGIDLR